MKLLLEISGILAVTIFAAGYVQKEVNDEYEHYQPSPYEYKYEVNDAKTGDQKSHHESRQGDVVKGYYSLMEADGTLREVHYTADKVNGFNAVVKKNRNAHLSKGECTKTRRREALRLR